LGSALIAFLTRVGLDDAIAAGRQQRTGAWFTAPPCFGFAVRTTAFANIGRVAGFTGLNATITAGELRLALFTGYADIASLLRLAVRRATGATLEATLVTHLARVDLAVAADEAHGTSASFRRTSMIGLYLADAVAAVACKGVTVVALLAVLVHDAVTAAGRSLHGATRGWIRHVAVNGTAGTAGA
jgi:hypothetical protein